MSWGDTGSQPDADGWIAPGSVAPSGPPAPVFRWDVTADLIDWVTSPTPWSVQPPTLVDIHTFTPTRRSRHELEDPDTVPAARPTRRGRKR